jgi:hypothetical protein
MFFVRSRIAGRLGRWEGQRRRSEEGRLEKRPGWAAQSGRALGRDRRIAGQGAMQEGMGTASGRPAAAAWTKRDRHLLTPPPL